MGDFVEKHLKIGSWINSTSSIIAEIMSASGFDFLVVDAEHSAIDFKICQDLFQAIKAGNMDCVPMVRMPGNQYQDIKRYLDAGAMGIIAPLVNTKEDAERIVYAAKYPPQGGRGVGYGRSHGYGFNFDKYMSRANEDIFICVQIEHILGVENLDEILSVSGINAVFIGPYDLSASMGITGQFNHTDYHDAIKTILDKCIKFNIEAGIHVVQPNVEEVFLRINEGFQMIAYSLDITMVGLMCRDGLKKIKSVNHD
jgi:2-dehydro-3-deoxyglucarate aldolase